MSETNQPKNPIPLQPIEKIRTNLISRVATTHTLTSDASSRSCQGSSLQNYDIKFTASAWGLKATPCSDGSRIEGCLFSWEAQVKAIILAELVSGAVYLRLVFLSLNGFFPPCIYIRCFITCLVKQKPVCTCQSPICCLPRDRTRTFWHKDVTESFRLEKAL